MTKWEDKEYKEVVFNITSKYNLSMGIISIFKLFWKNSISFSEKEIKYSSIKDLLASTKNNFSSKIILSALFIEVLITSCLIFSINYCKLSNIILIISDIPSV